PPHLNIVNLLNMKLQELNQKLASSVDFYKNELSVIKTAGANSSLVENIKVEAYANTILTLKELATISAPDATLLIITPWDGTTLKPIEKALSRSDLGFNPVIDKNTIKLPVPQLSQEQRQKYVKLVKEKLEESKISVRNVRQDAIKSIEEMEENGVISEDDLKRQKKEIEDAVKSTNTQLEQLYESKEKELLKV
ncbi:ribosome recycling factor, partial [Patescibacteria group bacterium]|nr:ribosome recycling factor [Patescibacteria group bacterium]